MESVWFNSIHFLMRSRYWDQTLISALHTLYFVYVLSILWPPCSNQNNFSVRKQMKALEHNSHENKHYTCSSILILIIFFNLICQIHSYHLKLTDKKPDNTSYQIPFYNCFLGNTGIKMGHAQWNEIKQNKP